MKRHHAATDLFLHALDKAEHGSLTLTDSSGTTYKFQGRNPGPEAHLQLHDEGVLARMLVKGDVAFADDYRNDRWDSPDICALIDYGLRNQNTIRHFIDGNPWHRYKAFLAYLLAPNNRPLSKANVQAHYDLGNDFYALWLDETMTYTCALFKDTNDSLATAQRHKMDRIFQTLGSRPRRILDIGCGWGGFIKRGCEHYDHHITGITLSHQQKQFAEQLNADNANSRILLQDYRDCHGQYDAIVSIEMIEAVGERYWQTYFNKVKALMNKNAQACIQAITIKEQNFAAYRKSTDAMRTYIFPGGMLISRQRLIKAATQAGLTARNIFSFGEHYATTLKNWLARFDAQRNAILQMGYDRAFVRLWRYYLSACAGSFQAGTNNVIQVELHHARS